MKIFTIQEANALLPNVRIILAKIQRAHRKLSHYRDEAKKAAEAAEQGGGGIADGVAYAAILTELTSNSQNWKVSASNSRTLSAGWSISLHFAMAAWSCSAGSWAKATNWSGGTTSTPGSPVARLSKPSIRTNHNLNCLLYFLVDHLKLFLIVCAAKWTHPLTPQLDPRKRNPH